MKTSELDRRDIQSTGDDIEILDHFSMADIAIVTRLHAAILASIAGCQIMPVAYQPKVADVLIQEEIVRKAISLDELLAGSYDVELDAYKVEVADKKHAALRRQQLVSLIDNILVIVTKLQ